MKIPVPPKHQWVGFWISMPVIAFLCCYILFDERVFNDISIWLIAYPLIYIMGYFSFRMHTLYDHFIRTRYPTIDQTGKRVMLKIPVYLLVMTPSALIIV